MSLTSARSAALLCFLAVFASMLTVADAASAVELGKPLPPVLEVEGGELTWTQPGNGVDIGGHNVHRGDGSYVTTVNGADRWDAEGVLGEYFVTAFDKTRGGAIISDRSNRVEITATGSEVSPDPVSPPVGDPTDPVDPSGDDRDTNIGPPRPTDVRIRSGRVEWEMPAGPSFVYQLTTNNSTDDDGQPWTQREVQNDPALTVTELDGGAKRFSYPVDGFRVGTTFRVEAIHPWQIAVTGPRSASSRFATVAPTDSGNVIPDFLGTFDDNGDSSIDGDWIGNRSEWSSTPQFVDDFDGADLSTQWYNAPDDVTPAYSRDQLFGRDNAQVRAGRLEMTVDKETSEYSYLSTSNNRGDGYSIDAANGVFLEASVRLDEAAPADNAWWGFWLMTPGRNAAGIDKAYDGNADTGSEVDLFEFVPDQSNGFNAAVYRSIPSNVCGTSEHRESVRTPEDGDCFSFDSPTDIPGVSVPNYMDGNYHRIGMYYSHDRYAFYIDDTLIWQVTDPEFITKNANLGIRLSWELQNINNPWSPALGGATTDSARDDDPTVYVDWVKVWEKTGGCDLPEPDLELG